MEKPTDFEEYKASVEEITGFDIYYLEEYYTRVVERMAIEFQESEFYRNLREELTRINLNYHELKGFDLIDDSKTLLIKIKPFESVLNKSYRNDIIKNELWNNEGNTWTQDYNWITPINCYDCLNDIVRTRITIRYIDGANQILDTLAKLSEDAGLDHSFNYLARENGYYGIHFELIHSLTKYNIDDTPEPIMATIEIQITTQIKDVVNELLHEYYEAERMIRRGGDKKWQWDHTSPVFLPNYLGHISHYIEGMILEARDKIRGV